MSEFLKTFRNLPASLSFNTLTEVLSSANSTEIPQLCLQYLQRGAYILALDAELRNYLVGPNSGQLRTHSRVTVKSLQEKYQQGQPITAVTAYDYPSAVHVDRAGFDIALVGDSAAMVVHGEETTLSMTLEELITHCKAVKRGIRRSFVVGDLPFGSYETSHSQAVRTAVRVVKEGKVDAVKLEGGSERRAEAVASIVEAGIAVVGHLGLTPQAVGTLGGFRPQGTTAVSALDIFHSALRLEKAGCLAIVLECVPKPLADAVTAALNIPTIGIGAGNGTSGQVLVFHDLLGFLQHPHHAKVTPKFCKQYAHVGEDIHSALGEFVSDVSTRKFPDEHHTPYKFEEGEMAIFSKGLEAAGFRTLNLD